MTDLIEVRRSRTLADAEQHALVLAAVGIESHLMAGDGVVRVCVSARVAERAGRQLAQYERENRQSPPSPRSLRPALQGLDAALAYCAVLLFFFGADRRDAFSIDWTAAGAAQAGLILDGEWWRTLTSLTLHADLGHLVSNLITGVVFGLLVAQLFGSGLAWLAILSAGAFGNALNALLQSPAHTAIGASTAIFGALGILSGYMRRTRIVPWRGGIRRWAPLGAGILLLAFLGFGGERTDVWAHVTGFAVGGVMGWALAPTAHRLAHRPGAQLICGALVCGLLSLAWLLALFG